MTPGKQPQKSPRELTGAQLQMMRVTHKLSQRQLAPLLGITHTHLSRIESGKRDLTDPMKRQVAVVLAQLPAPERSA